jgi:hypothetical protein
MQGWYRYSDEYTTDFATIWMQEMLKQNKTFYSLMHMRLFGEHFGGMRVNIDGIKDFDRALELIPDYLEYIFAYEGFDDEYSGKFDPDCELYKLIVAMREQEYGEAKIVSFATHWVAPRPRKSRTSFALLPSAHYRSSVRSTSSHRALWRSTSLLAQQR